MSTNEFYLNDLWSNTLNKVKASNQIEEEVFELYIANSKLQSLEKNEAIITVPGFINKAVISNHLASIEHCFEEAFGQYLPITVYETSKYQETIVPKRSEFVFEHGSALDPRFTFANFVVGRSNAQAQVACLTVATNPGIIYNPLFVYGNSGLGKTHLLNAIGNQVLANNPNKKICYISGIDFVEGVFKSIKEKKIEEFKSSFRELDLLLVDDIQFIAGKEKTHEVFFTIFNDLVNNRKQVCLTADKKPGEIKGLEARIISRFNQGLNVNIEAPEYETSLNIIKMKISNNTMITQTIDEDVISYIASNFSQDVRSLEGAINRLLFYSINFGEDPNGNIDLKLASEAFKDQVTEIKDEMDISRIKKAVCDYYNLTIQQLISKTRTQNITNARHIAMYLCRKILDSSYKDIGREFGGRDHSTVISACEKVEENIKKDPLYLRALNDLETKIRQ